MTFLLDVNVLMALLWENHEHHHVARAWLRRATDFATCPVSQLGFARVSTSAALTAFMVFGDVAVRHPNQHRILPDKVWLGDSVTAQD